MSDLPSLHQHRGPFEAPEHFPIIESAHPAALAAKLAHSVESKERLADLGDGIRIDHPRFERRPFLSQGDRSLAAGFPYGIEVGLRSPQEQTCRTRRLDSLFDAGDLVSSQVRP